jgi:PAS domain S-box-containing protein
MNSNPSRSIYAETLTVFDRSEHRHEPLTTPEVADALDAERRTVYKRLRELVDRGKLKTKETGANSRVWWRPPGDSYTVASSSVDDEPAAGVDATHPQRNASNAGGEASRSAGRRRMNTNYGEIFETFPDGVSLHDPADGTLIDVNRRLCELFGYTREELLELEFGALHADVPSYTGDQAEQYIRQAATDGPRTFEWLCERKDGDHFPVEIHLRWTTIDGNDRILTVIRDITARTDHEWELSEMNRQLRAALDIVDGANFIKTADGRYQHMNDECKELIGLDTDTDITGLTDEDLFSDEVVERYRAGDRRVLKESEPVEREDDVPTPRGPRTHLTTKSPLFDAEGEPIGVFGVTVDITDRRRRRREMQAHSMAMEQSIDGMAILDSNGEYTFVNQAHADIYGYDDPDAFLGETWRMCYEEDKLDQFQNEVMSTLFEEGSWRGEVIGQRKDGTTFPQELSLTTTDDSIICVVRDITDRRQRERELRETSQRLNLALNATDTGVWEWNLETDEVVWSEAFERLLGIEPGTSASTFEALFNPVHPEDAPGVKQSLENAINGDGTFHDEHRMRREDGEQIWVENRANIFTNDGMERMVGTVTDITDRKESERELARRKSLDPSIELEFHSEQLAEAILQQTETELTFTIDRVVPQSDEKRLVYGTVRGITAKEFQSVVDSIPNVQDIRLLSTVGDSARCEVLTREGSISDIFGAFDGELRSIVIENGTCKLTGEFSETADSEAIGRSIRETYPDAELASQRRIVTPNYVRSLVEDLLTERQRTVLKMAYHADYFERPRGSTGDELADRLGITRQTVNNHLRKAQSAVLQAIFEDAAEPGTD